jgi:hypothetical protein
MMRIDKKEKILQRLPDSDLKDSEILERKDLQQAIINSWNEFRLEIKSQDLFLIGQEVVPHNDVSDRIDILAYSSVENTAVVIELKRSSNKLQLLQALSYGAMISGWNSSQLLTEARKQNAFELEDIEDGLKEVEVLPKARIVLLAESFDPEVMITADWLYQQYSVDIMAYSMQVFRNDSQIYINIIQRYPLAELSDAYSLRKRTQKSEASTELDVNWDEVAKTLQYPWGAKAIKLCQVFKAGEPARRRFGSIRTSWDGFNWISINFRRAYVNVYLKGSPEDAEQIIQSKFKDSMEIGNWRDGFSCKIKTEAQFSELVAWLQLNNSKR